MGIWFESLAAVFLIELSLLFGAFGAVGEVGYLLIERTWGALDCLDGS